MIHSYAQQVFYTQLKYSVFKFHEIGNEGITSCSRGKKKHCVSWYCFYLVSMLIFPNTDSTYTIFIYMWKF